MNESTPNPRELSSEDAESILAGAATREHADLAAFVSAMSVNEVLVGEELATARIAAAVRKERRFNKSVPAKIAAIAFGAVLSIGGAAAAATGSLPNPAQEFASVVAAEVGVDLPTGGETDSGDITPVPGTTTTTVPDETTTTIVVDPTTTTTSVEGVVKSGKETCEAARAVEGANGCSDVAKTHAPGQQKKAESTTTTEVGAESPKEKGKSADAKSKNDDTPKGGSSHSKK